MGLYVLPLYQNDHPTTAQGPEGLLEVTRKITFVQPDHAGLKTCLPLGPRMETNLRNLEI